MTEYNGSIYGQGYDSSGGRELFVMNGTTWQMLVDLSPGSHFGVPKMTNPSHLTVLNGWLYFDTTLGKIYRTNGTSAGTTQFTTGTTKGYTPMQVFKNELYFVAQGTGASGYELWKTDGTNITLVKDVNSQSSGANSGFCTGTSYTLARPNSKSLVITCYLSPMMVQQAENYGLQMELQQYTSAERHQSCHFNIVPSKRILRDG